MSVFFGRRAEPEARAFNDPDFYPVTTGVTVTSAPAALRLIPLYAAVTGIADDVSVMPWHAYQDSGQGWGDQLTEQPQILTDPDGTGMGFIGWMNQGVTSACLWGFAFGLILAVDRTGFPSIVRWVDPARVTIDETGPSPVFKVDQVVVDRQSVVYIPGPVLPGSIKGLSPTSLFRLQFGKSLTAQQYAADTFARGIMPPGVLKNLARTLPAGAAAEAKAKFKASVAARDIFVTGNDWDWTPLAVPDDDAKFLEVIKAGATEVAAIYRVAPEDIGGETGGSMTYGTVELNELKRNRRALLPWVRRFEQGITAIRPPQQYVKANMDALVRADLKTRMEAHEIALRIGLETNPEGRALEDKRPLTTEQTAQWQALYGKGDTVTPAAAEARAAAELLQKIYLAVGPVITADEAREIATKAGAGLTAPFTPAPKAPPTTEGRTP